MEANTGEDDRAGQTARALAKSQCRQRYYCTQIGTGRQSRHYLWQGSGSNVPWYPTKAPAPEHERTLEIVAATSKCPKRLSTVQPATTHLPRKTAHSHGACSAILGVAVGDLGPSGRLL